jgi:hypothetical protein
MKFNARIMPKGLNEDNSSVYFYIDFDAPCYQDAERYLNGTYGHNKWDNLWSV